MRDWTISTLAQHFGCSRVRLLYAIKKAAIVPGLPSIARVRRYSDEQLRDVAAALANVEERVPAIQTTPPAPKRPRGRPRKHPVALAMVETGSPAALATENA